jgi:Fic-DOC domain mobile mystery protein B
LGAVNEINKSLPPGSTPLTAEELEGLIPRHVTTRKDLNDAEFRNYSEAEKMYLLSKRKKAFRLDPLDLYRLHKEMFGHVWKWAGKKRLTNKNIGVDKAQIDVEMMKLKGDLVCWLEQEQNRQLGVLEISARLHHRLVYIHPFCNGNGRWARFVVNLFLRDKTNSFIRFPEDDLKVSTEIRDRYIQALHAADNWEYGPLIALHREFIGPATI